MKFVAIKQYKDGAEQVYEYFATRLECLDWIQMQPQPKTGDWAWCVGEYA